MTTFLDGPAQGQHLSLRRSPLYLRVVCDAAGHWDALDQIDDTPAPGETIHAYRRAGAATVCHLLIRGNRDGRRSGWYSSAQYLHLREQPSATELRDTALWQAWCRRHATSQPIA